VTADELQRFLLDAFPDNPPTAIVEEVGDRRIRLRLPYEDRNLRPGGTISGPALMSLADSTAWLSVLAEIGPVAMAVTSNLTIQFLRKPAAADVIAEGELLRLGRRNAVTDVRMRSAADDRLVAQATVTYAIPEA